MSENSPRTPDRTKLAFLTTTHAFGAVGSMAMSFIEALHPPEQNNELAFWGWFTLAALLTYLTYDYNKELGDSLKER